MDQEGFLRLSLPLKDDLYRLARSLSASDADALDLVQETYLHAWRAFPRYREDQRFRPWIFTILRHAHLDQCRRRKVRPATDEIAEEGIGAPASEGVHDVQAALERLRPGHHLLLLLREVQGFSYAEIAEVLGCPVGSVMSGLHHARSSLRRVLEGGSRKQEAS